MRIDKYRFFFYSNEGNEPPHIHVQAGEDEAKLWLNPVELARNDGFNTREINTILRHIRDNLAYLIEVWDEHFRPKENDAEQSSDDE